MAHNPKLEVYSLILPKIEKNGNTFRDVLSEKLYGNGVKVGTDQEIFNDYFQNFISILDNPDFIADESKKKAITAYDTDPSRQKPSIGFKSEQFVIHGNIEGGRYGQKRNKSSMSNKMTKEDLTKDAIILDKFFFYLYTPFESDLGVLMIQSYTDDSISDVFLNCIKDLFHIKGYKKPKTPKFVPQAIIEEFSNDSFIKKFTYSSRFLLSQLSNNPIGEKDQHFNIKIEVVSTDDIPKGALPSWLSSLGDKIFNNAPLKEFTKGKVYLRNSLTKKESPFDITSDMDIKPTIYLEGRVNVDDDGMPDFDELKEYCSELLESIKPELYPVYSINGH